MGIVLLKAGGIWILLVSVAAFNGAMREKLLVLLLGSQLALPLSGVLLSILIFLITLFLVPSLRLSVSWQYWLVGAMWLLLTVIFEFVFGHYVTGTSWSRLLEAFNVVTGNLLVLVLITTTVSPYLAAKLRGLI